MASFALCADPAKWPALPDGCVLYRIRHRDSGNSYIGATTRGLRLRLRMHKGTLGRGRDLPIYRAMRKHGLESFDVDVIAIADSAAELWRLEREAIARERPKYNCTGGGEGTLGYRHPPEIIEQIAEKLRGRVGHWRGKRRDPAIIEKMRAANLANHPRFWLGKKRDDETKAKISAAKSGKPRTPSSRYYQPTPAECGAHRQKKTVCLNDGVIYPSAKHAALAYDLNPLSVSAVCRGRYAALHGKRFAYLEVANG